MLPKTASDTAVITIVGMYLRRTPTVEMRDMISLHI
jgi:hypothetical protein